MKAKDGANLELTHQLTNLYGEDYQPDNISVSGDRRSRRLPSNQVTPTSSYPRMKVNVSVNQNHNYFMN